MAVTIRFDRQHTPIPPTLVLCTKNARRLGKLPAYNITYADSLNAASEIVGRVDKFNNSQKYKYWESVKDFRLVWCKEWNRLFEISVEVEDQSGLTKTFSGVSLGESELGQILLHGIEINTEDDIARDDYVVTILYDAQHPEASLLNRITEKAPHYKITYVADSIKNIQRTFTFDNTSIYDAFQEIAEEINCYFDINVGFAEDGSINRTIAVYDLESYCRDCHTRGEFISVCPDCGSTNIDSGYGNDTTISVSVENLADSITYSVDTGAVKNCMYLEAGDDLMTATIVNANPNGTPYIWYISDEQKEDMSPELVSKIESYDALYADYQNSHVIHLDEEMAVKYNAVVEKYYQYDSGIHTTNSSLIGYPALMNLYYDTIDLDLFLSHSMMPSPVLSGTTATQQAAKLTSSSMSPTAVLNLDILSASTADSAVLSMAKVLVDPRYQVKIVSSSFSGQRWTGSFKITNYSDEEDTAQTDTISVTISDNYQTYVQQAIDKVLARDVEDVSDIVSIFKLTDATFRAELKKYGLASLQIFYDACEACLNILIQQGISDSSSSLYGTFYSSYLTKQQYIGTEIAERQADIYVVTGEYDSNGLLVEEGMQSQLSDIRREIQNALNFEGYIGETLWKEFSSFRREDTYSNSNYISDGLNNSEIFANAREFLEVAQQELYTSATRQHMITATLKNLLAMKEFEPIISMFELGNWIRVKTDDRIFKLRLVKYTVDFDDLATLEVEFSDVLSTADGISDVQSILDQATSMATSYDSVARQAGQGKSSHALLEDWVNDGLDATNVKIVNAADNQDIVYDKHGILCRTYDPMLDQYDPTQTKIIGDGLYVTNDYWKHAKAGIGHFTYLDPETLQYREAYGVIADTIVGNIMLSKEVGIYNPDMNIAMDNNGMTLTADVTEDTSLREIFCIQRKELDTNGDISYQKLMYLDSEGNLVIDGSGITQISGDKIITGTLDASAINVDQAFANAVFAHNITATGTITGAVINGSAINGGTIRGASITGNTIDISGTATGGTSGTGGTYTSQSYISSDSEGITIGYAYRSSGTHQEGGTITINSSGIYFETEAGDVYVNGSALPTLERIYPVGAIYISTVSTSPATLFGFGSWTRIQGRFLLGAGSGYTAGATGGEATHTLTTSEMPPHAHPMYVYNGSSSSTWSPSVGSYLVTAGSVSSSKNTYNAQLGMNNTGGGSAHNNMPPYYVVYMWRRSA